MSLVVRAELWTLNMIACPSHETTTIWYFLFLAHAHHGLTRWSEPQWCRFRLFSICFGPRHWSVILKCDLSRTRRTVTFQSFLTNEEISETGVIDILRSVRWSLEIVVVQEERVWNSCSGFILELLRYSHHPAELCTCQHSDQRNCFVKPVSYTMRCSSTEVLRYTWGLNEIGSDSQVLHRGRNWMETLMFPDIVKCDTRFRLLSRNRPPKRKPLWIRRWKVGFVDMIQLVQFAAERCKCALASATNDPISLHQQLQLPLISPELDRLACDSSLPVSVLDGKSSRSWPAGVHFCATHDVNVELKRITFDIDMRLESSMHVMVHRL
jgi:hypothetical protein